VHARPVERHVVHVVQALADPVGVEDGDLGDLLQAVAAIGQDVSEGAGQHEGIAVPGVDPADRLGRGLPAELAPGGAHRSWAGQERHQALGHGYRTGTGSSPAVGRGERLVQIHMDDVEAHVARADHPEDGIQVGAVVVQEPADLVEGGGDLGDVLLEQAEGVRIGQHDAGHVLVEHRPQCRHVDTSPGIARDGDHLVAA
jgi:hypothetical protein